MSRLHLGEHQAEKIVQADGRWAVAVEKSDVTASLAFLDAKRIVSTRSQVKDPSQSSFIPSREEQWFHYENSVAAGIENTLMRLPGVLDARVHLNLPKRDALFGGGVKELGSGSVLLVVENISSSNDEKLSAIVGSAAGIPAASVNVMRIAPDLQDAEGYTQEASTNLTTQEVSLIQPTVFSPISLQGLSLIPSNNLGIFAYVAAVILILLATYLGARRLLKHSRQDIFALQNGYDHEK